jgi:cell volume regulation protein A
MTNTIILIIAGTLLWAYAVDIMAKRLHIPAVIPLVASGLGLNIYMQYQGLTMDWLDLTLPVLGTVGLILIVLEGALDLKLQRDKAGLMVKSLLSASIAFFLCAVAYAYLFDWAFDFNRYTAIALAIPFAIISSAVAIPSSRALDKSKSEFVVYESSISDILGVLVFFAWLEATDNASAFSTDLIGGGALSLLLSVIFSLGLIWLIGQVKGHVRFLPILAMLFLLYGLGKGLHLSPLILVLGFGLMLNNIALIRRIPKVERFLDPQIDSTVSEFKSQVSELEFGVRSVFFIMLGLWTPLESLQDYRAWLLSFSIIAILLIIRIVLLKILRLDIKQLLWLAPRGLITVLLALTAMETIDIGNFPQGAVMLTVLSTCLLVLLARPKAELQEPLVETSRIETIDELDEIAKPGEVISSDKAPDNV